MPEIQLVPQTQMTGRYAAWFVHGAWWVVSLEGDETVVPDGPPPWPTPCPN